MKWVLTAFIIMVMLTCGIAGCKKSEDGISGADISEKQSETAVSGENAEHAGAGKEQSKAGAGSQTEDVSADAETELPETDDPDGDENPLDEKAEDVDPVREISLDPSWEYAEFSKIHSGTAILYRTDLDEPKGKVVCVNAGHGTDGGERVMTQCHPDGSKKVVSGSTSAGSLRAAAVSSGMAFEDGTPEGEVTLKLALILKEDLLDSGYDVLMIRETDDVQLDNIARTVIANQNADCHIALHWDSGSSDKGAFYISAPEGSYREMEPVASHWKEHEALGQSLIDGLDDAGVSIFSDGKMAIDLTQTSYSTIPSVDIELGDSASDHGKKTLKKISGGLLEGIERFFAL